MTPIDFPNMFEAVLDEHELEVYFGELQKVGVVEVRTKESVREHTHEIGTLSLEKARTLFRKRDIKLLQLRYRYDDSEWWDTLLDEAEGARIVRLRHDFDDESAP